MARAASKRAQGQTIPAGTNLPGLGMMQSLLGHKGQEVQVEMLPGSIIYPHQKRGRRLAVGVEAFARACP